MYVSYVGALGTIGYWLSTYAKPTEKSRLRPIFLFFVI